MELQDSTGDIQDPIRGILHAARWVIMVGVLLESRLHYAGARLDRTGILESVVAVAAITVILRRAARKWHLRRSFLVLTIADIGMATLVVYFSDGLQSPFYALFYVTVIEAAANFGTRGALVCSAVITVLSLVAELADVTKPITQRLVFDDLVRTTPYLFLISVIAGALTDRVRILADIGATLREDRRRTEREMEVARSVQQAQLPAQVPEIRGLEIAVVYKPAREVGGDLYDFYPVIPDQLGVVVADVAGKGVPAALLVSTAKYAIREHYGEDIAGMMRGVNDHLMAVTTDDSFVTMLYGILTPTTGEFAYVNAGQMPPIVVKESGATVCHRHSDVPAAIMAGVDYTARRIQLKPGDTLVLYTDGVTDALAREQSGVEELEEFLSQVAAKSLIEWREEIERRIAAPRHVDDVTLVAIRWKHA